MFNFLKKGSNSAGAGATGASGGSGVGGLSKGLGDFNPMAVDLSKTGLTDAMVVNLQKTDLGVNLLKSAVNLDGVLANSQALWGVDLSRHKARVVVDLDISGSMSELLNGGVVQQTLARIVPLALRFDDNGELDVFVFDNCSSQLEGMTLDNFSNYVKSEVMPKFRGYGTDYDEVINDNLKFYFKKSKSNLPVFCLFITDGASSDKSRAKKAIIKSSHENIFYQFVGIGPNDNEFKFLEKLDDLEGRPVDNTGFIRMRDLDRMGTDECFKELLSQYPDWLRDKGLA